MRVRRAGGWQDGTRRGGGPVPTRFSMEYLNFDFEFVAAICFERFSVHRFGDRSSRFQLTLHRYSSGCNGSVSTNLGLCEEPLFLNLAMIGRCCC